MLGLALPELVTLLPPLVALSLDVAESTDPADSVDACRRLADVLNDLRRASFTPLLLLLPPLEIRFEAHAGFATALPLRTPEIVCLRSVSI